MADEPRLRAPNELALEQLVVGLIFHLEKQRPGEMDAIFRTGAGFPRFSVETDIAYQDLVLTIRGKARQAGIID
jgi:hypothetical protein